MPPSINIASFQNCGTERYICIDNKRLTAFIDVMQDKDYQQYTATLQYGVNLSWIISTCYTFKTKKRAVLMAFDRMVDMIDIELLDDVSCPEILRPYKLQKNVEKKEIVKKEEALQLKLIFS